MLGILLLLRLIIQLDGMLGLMFVDIQIVGRNLHLVIWELEKMQKIGVGEFINSLVIKTIIILLV